MNKSEKIKLLKYLFKEYGCRKKIHKSKDARLKKMSDDEQYNFFYWAKDSGCISFEDSVPFIYIEREVGPFLENEREKNERMRIENDRLRLLGEALDRTKRDMSVISGVPYEYLYPNNPTDKKDIKFVDTGGGDYIDTGGGDVCKDNKSWLGDIRIQKTIFINKIKEKGWKWWVVVFGGFIISLLTFLILIF